jgi:hypothetical protein
VPAPTGILEKAVKKVPSVKYALGVAGVVSAVAIIAGFKIDWRVAAFGTVVMFVFMTVLTIFSASARLKGPNMVLPATILVWFSLVLFIAVASCLFTWIVADWPSGLATILDAGLRPNATPGTGLLKNTPRYPQPQSAPDQNRSQSVPSTIVVSPPTGKPKSGHPSKVEPTQKTQHQPVDEPTVAATPASSPGICDAGPHRAQVQLALPVTPGADLYADNQVCRENIPSESNMVIFLPQGTHHLVLRRGTVSCSADPTVPLPNEQPVIITCQ